MQSKQYMQSYAEAMLLYKDHNYRNTHAFDLNGWYGWARVVNVHDGDTITVIMSLKGEVYKVNVRIFGIDTPELYGIDRDAALRARDAVIEWCTQSYVPCLSTAKQVIDHLDQSVTLVYLQCQKMDKYGRVLANVYHAPNGVSLTSWLIDNKLGVQYFGGHKVARTIDV